jgi:hypothetical protein
VITHAASDEANKEVLSAIVDAYQKVNGPPSRHPVTVGPVTSQPVAAATSAKADERGSHPPGWHARMPAKGSTASEASGSPWSTAVLGQPTAQDVFGTATELARSEHISAADVRHMV